MVGLKLEKWHFRVNYGGFTPPYALESFFTSKEGRYRRQGIRFSITNKSSVSTTLHIDLL